MASNEMTSDLMKLTESKKLNLQKSMLSLLVNWKDLDQHFDSTHQSLHDKFDQLESKENQLFSVQNSLSESNKEMDLLKKSIEDRVKLVDQKEKELQDLQHQLVNDVSLKQQNLNSMEESLKERIKEVEMREEALERRLSEIEVELSDEEEDTLAHEVEQQKRQRTEFEASSGLGGVWAPITAVREGQSCTTPAVAMELARMATTPVDRDRASLMSNDQRVEQALLHLMQAIPMLSGLSDSIKTSHDQIPKLKKEIAGLRLDLQKSGSELEKVKAALALASSEHRNKVAELEGVVAALSLENAALKDENATLNGDLDRVSQKSLECSAQLERFEARINNMKDASRQLFGRVLKRGVHRSRKAMKAAEVDYSSLNQLEPSLVGHTDDEFEPFLTPELLEYLPY